MRLPTYVLEGGRSGRERLRLLAGTMRPLTLTFLDSLHIHPGVHCLDVGCGGGDVSRLLAERVGMEGSVTAVDADADILAIAESETTGDAASIVRFVHDDATRFVTERRFDVIYARFFLSHVPDPAGTLRHLYGLLQPDGILAVEDVWFPGHFCWPPSAAFETYVDWYRRAARARGADADIGIKLPALFSGTELTDIRHQMLVPSFRTGEEKFVTLLTLDRIRQSVLVTDIADDRSYARLYDELEALTQSPDSTVSMAPVMQIHGRRPTTTGNSHVSL